MEEQCGRGVQQHRGALKLPENGQEGAKASECHAVEKTEKRALHPGEVLLKEFLNAIPGKRV